jgi:hypothetical protein
MGLMPHEKKETIMSFTVKFNGKEVVFEKKVALLDLIKDDADCRQFICAKVNNRVRELTYEVYYDATVEFLTLQDHDAVKVYEASLRYVLAMAFARCYPKLRVRFAYNVSRCVSVHLLDPNVTGDTAMLIKLNHEMEKIIAADFPLKREIVPNDEALKIYAKCGFADKTTILKYRPEKTVHLYECDGYLNYMYSHMVPSTGYLTSYKLRLYAPGFLLQYPRSEAKGEIPPFEDAPTFGRTLKESHDWAKVVGVDTVAHINDETRKGRRNRIHQHLRRPP